MTVSDIFDHVRHVAQEEGEKVITPIVARLIAKRRRRQQFIIVPWSWFERLRASDRGSTYRVALFLQHSHWRNGGQPIKLSNKVLTGVGVARRSKWNALRELEQLGLIRVDRQGRRSPVITLVAD
jgi:hypothetical protein